MGKSVFIILISLISAQAAWAQLTTLQTQAPSQRSNWSGFSSMGYSSNMYSQGTSSAQAFGSASILANYRFSGENLARASFSGFQEQNKGREAKLNDGFIGWVNNGFWKKGKVLTVGQQVRAVVPSSKESRVRDEKLLGVSVIPSLMFNMTPVGLTGATLIYQPGLTKNFHSTQQNKTFQNNTSFTASQTFALAWSLTDKIYIQPVFAYVMGWSYGGVKRPDSYQVSFESGYNINSNLITSLGVTNAGAIRNFENGNDQTIQLFNNRTASLYMDLTYVF